MGKSLPPPLPLPNSSDIHSKDRRKVLASQEIDKFYADGFESHRCIHDFRAEDPDQ